MTFNKNISGCNYTASNASAMIYELRADGKFAGTSGYTNFNGDNTEKVTLTGWQTVSSYSGSQMSQLVSGKWIDLTDGWTATGTKLNYSVSAAQKFVDEILANNKIILCNNLLCARFSNRLTRAEQQTLYELQTRLDARNQSLLNDGLVTEVGTSSPVGYAELEAWLTQFMQNGIGLVLSTTAVIAITAVVVSSLATAAYFAYKAYAAEASADVKFSNELTETLLSRLTDEEYNQLMNETKGLVTKASLKARFSTGWNIAKVALWGVAIFAGIWAFKQYKNQE